MVLIIKNFKYKEFYFNYYILLYILILKNYIYLMIQKYNYLKI